MREQFLELLRTDPQFRDEVRLLVLTEDLLALPGKVDRLVEAVHELTTVQRQQTEQILALTEAQRRTQEQIQGLFHQLNELVAAQHRMEEALTWLIDWQRGEAGRREGERYERQVIRRAPVLFNGGNGGPPDDPSVQQRLTALLPPEQRERLLHNEEDDPFLSDLIWWKGERVAVVEASLQVDGYDVTRADHRAATLREAGIPAIGVVIGKEWADIEAHDVALGRGVEWLIGREMSEGFRKFRELEA